MNIKDLLQKFLTGGDWQTAIAVDGMTIEIVPAQRISSHAHEAAEAGLSLSACPFPPGSQRARHWCYAYHGKALELLGKTEQFA